jgi:predicted MFS family arabinose efflux permease
LITFFSAIVIDGIIVVVLGVLFLHFEADITPVMATMLAAFYLGYRRICLVVLSPAGGWIADQFGLDKVFSASMCMVVLGLLFIVSGWIAVGAAIVFTFYGINSAITPGSASNGKKNALHAVAENATWKDIGAATGTLIGGLLISSTHLTTILIICTFTLPILLILHMKKTQNAFKYFYVWK